MTLIYLLITVRNLSLWGLKQRVHICLLLATLINYHWLGFCVIISDCLEKRAINNRKRYIPARRFSESVPNGGLYRKIKMLCWLSSKKFFHLCPIASTLTTVNCIECDIGFICSRVFSLKLDIFIYIWMNPWEEKKVRDIYACRIAMALAYFTQKWIH